MKHLLLTLAFLVSGFAQAQSLELKDLVVEDAKKFKFTFEQALQDKKTAKAAVDTVVYDLKHMPELIKDLTDHADAGSNGLTRQVVEEVRRRFKVANALVTSLMIDTKIPIEDKKDMISDITGTLTDVLFQVTYTPGETQDSSKQTGKLTLMKLVLKNWASDISVLFRVKAAAKLKEVDANGQEINASGSWVPAIADRSRRDALTLELIQEVQESLYMTMNALDDNNAIEQKFIPTYWGEKKGPRLIQMRSYDLNAERIAAASYLGFAIWGLLMPAWDMVGAFDGGRSEFSLVDSSFIYATFWTSIAAVKASTISSSAVQELRKLVAMTKDQTIQPTRGKISGFWARLGSSVAVVKDGCMAALSSGKK